MEEKFRIGDMEYTIHTGSCTSGGNLLCSTLPGANEPLIKQWLRHGEAGPALRRAAGRIKPVTGACDNHVYAQLNHEAVHHRLKITARKVRPRKAAGIMGSGNAAPQPQARAPRNWWQAGDRPLGPGCWELDKTPLSRQPDDQKGHKLALEIAGTRQISLQGELVAASHAGAIARYNLSRGGTWDDHRRQIFIRNLEPGRFGLHLKLQDHCYGSYAIPLDTGRELSTCPMPAKSAQWQTVLVPMIPRTYKTVHLKREGEHCGYPADGWIYLYLDGRLWREVQVRDKGWFADVNLAMEKGGDHRRVTGRADRTILVPFQVEGRRPDIHMCYSQAQWSWAQIEALGGLAAGDTRLQKGPVPEPVATADFPQSRLQPVDLSAYPAFENGSGCVGDAAQKGDNLDHVRPDLRAFSQTRLPVVYLHDALGIAESLVARYQEKLAAFRQMVADLPALADVDDLDPVVAQSTTVQKEAYFRTAVLAYRVFFDPETTMDKAQWEDLAAARHTHGSAPEGKTPLDLGGLSLFKRRTGAPKRPKIFDTCQAELDRSVIENVLRVRQRREFRAELRELKKVLTDFLEDRIENKPATSRRDDFIGVNAMLADYANLNDLDYGLLWSKAGGLFGFLGHEPCSEDPDLDIAADIAAEMPRQPQDDPGHAFLQTLFDPTHPLCGMLWPTRDQVDHGRADAPIPQQPEPSDGGGLFRTGAFHAAVKNKRVSDRPLDRGLNDLAGINHEITAHVLWVFKNQWRQIRDAKSELAVHTLVRFLKASGHPALGGLHVIPAGSTIDLKGNTHVVVGAGPARFQALAKAPFMNRRPGSSAEKRTRPDKNRVYRTRPDDPVAPVPADGIGRYTDQPPGLTRKQWQRFWGRAKNKNETVYEARTSLVVMPAKCRYAVDYYTGSINTITKSTIKYARKTLPPVIAVLEMVNFGRASSALIDQAIDLKIETKLAAETFLSLISMSYFLLDAAVALAGQKPVKSALGKLGNLIFEKKIKFLWNRITVYNAAGAGVSGLMAVTSAWNSFYSIMQRDYDAASGYAIAAGAFTGLTLAKLGLAKVALFAGIVPWSVPLLIVGVAGGAYAFLMTDSDLEKWVKHGPYASSPEDRWRNCYKDRNPRFALEGLIGSLLKPEVSMAYSNDHPSHGDNWLETPLVMVKFYVPGYDTITDELKVEVTAQRGTHVDGAMATLKMARGEEDYEQQMQVPIKKETITDNRTNQVLGVRHYYKGLGPVGSYQWRVRARHIMKQTNNEIVIPPLLGKSECHDNKFIDLKAPGWVYAEI